MSKACPDEADILEAVQASGYLMEQEVASKLEALGFHVRPAMAFKDKDEGKSREIDVSAFDRFLVDEERKIVGFCEILAECKQSSNPFVFLTRNKSTYDESWVPPSLDFPLPEYEARKDQGNGRALIQSTPAFRELGFQAVNSFHTLPRKAVQFCRIDRSGGGWSANHNGLYDAIFLPLIKALLARKADTKPRGGKDDYRYARFFFPIVVVRGKIYEIDTQGADRKPVEVPHIPFVRDLKADGIEGRFLVDFVNEDHLGEFVETVVRGHTTKFHEAYSSNAKHLLTKDRPWRNA